MSERGEQRRMPEELGDYDGDEIALAVRQLPDAVENCVERPLARLDDLEVGVALGDPVEARLDARIGSVEGDVDRAEIAV